MVTGRISFVFLAFLLTGLGTVQAAPLNLILGTPDISSGFMSTTYNATTDLFAVDGSFASGTLDGANIANQTFFLNANISAGGVLNSGSLTISGTSGIYNSGTLLTGNLLQVGFSNATPLSGLLEFLFTPTGGDLLAEYGGGNGGIILSASGYDGNSFNTDFSGAPFNSFADTAPVVVPVPAAVWLFGSGLLGLMGFIKRVRI